MKQARNTNPNNPTKEVAELNELDLALQLQERHQLYYSRGLNYFERYNPATGVWEAQADHQIKAHVVDLIASLHSRKKTSIPALSVTRLVSSALTILKYQVPEPPTTDHQNLVCVKNGVLDLNHHPARLLKLDPAYHLTIGSPVIYDPSATCPMFTSVLLGNGFDPDDVSLIQRVFGGVLLGGNIGQVILILKGTAGIGKSTMVTIMEYVIGLNNVAYLRTQHLEGRFELASFVGKTLLVGKDVSQDFLSVKGAGILKSLVGDDFLQGERKSSNKRIDLQGRFHVVITCNSDITIPAAQDQDAWRRRLLVVNSQHRRPERIVPDLAGTILREESSGVLNWLIEGAEAHKKELAEFGSYQLTNRQRQEIDRMVHVPAEVKVGKKVGQIPPP